MPSSSSQDHNINTPSETDNLVAGSTKYTDFSSGSSSDGSTSSFSNTQQSFLKDDAELQKVMDSILHAVPPAVACNTAEVSYTAFALGTVLGVSLIFALSLGSQAVLPLVGVSYTSITSAVHALLNPTNIPWQLPTYFCCLCVFHFMEYWTTATYNPQKVLPSSFLLRNGQLYLIAHSLALTETLVLRYFNFWPFTKIPNSIRLVFSPDNESKAGLYISLVGLLVVIAGQTLRSCAMIHAASNFSHTIVKARDSAHQLVTTGVYSLSRHPSYSGFYFWALGSQILLVNPVSFVVFLCLLWNFFSNRIKDEEQYLILFFGKDYIEYKKKTPTLIPFIK